MLKIIRKPYLSLNASNCLQNYMNSKIMARMCASQQKGKSSESLTQQNKKILVKDESGRILNFKSTTDAQIFAKKANLRLISDENHANPVTSTFRLVSPKKLIEIIDSVDNQSTNESLEETHESPINDTKDSKDKNKSVKKVREVKHSTFSFKASEHDLMIKINQIKKWVIKDCEVRVHVTGSANKSVFENIYKQFEKQLKGKCRFAQKNLKEDRLKFIILPLKDSKEVDFGDDKEVENDSIDFDNLDANQLLSDDFDLDKKL